MESFLVRFRVGNKTEEQEIFASNEHEAKQMMLNQIGWEHPKKSVTIIAVKSLITNKKRLKSRREPDKDAFGY
jgi:hypothetical protein